MRRPVLVLGAFGAVLGGCGAVGWHWLPEFGERGSSSTAQLPPGSDPYSGVVADDQVIHWVPVSWWVVVVLPLVGAVLGAALGAALARWRDHRPTPPRAAVAEPVVALALGLLLGVVSVMAWHYDPPYGTWAGLFEVKVDIGYPVAGLVLALMFLAVGHLGAARRPRAEPSDA